MTRWGLVVDASGSRVTRPVFRQLKSMGCQGFIQCLQTGGFSSFQTGVDRVAQPNLSDALDEELLIGGYLNSQPWRDPSVIHEDAISVAGPYWDLMQMVANDVEIHDPVPNETQIRGTQNLLESAGKRAPIYTAKWFWEGHLGNPKWSWLAGSKLWNAFYDGDPDVDFARFPYGPWTQASVVGEQYVGTTNIGGAQFDLNFFDLDYLQAQPEEDDLNTTQAQQLQEIHDALFHNVPTPAGQESPHRRLDNITLIGELYNKITGWKVGAGDSFDDKYTGLDWRDEVLLRLRDNAQYNANQPKLTNEEETVLKKLLLVNTMNQKPVFTVTEIRTASRALEKLLPGGVP